MEENNSNNSYDSLIKPYISSADIVESGRVAVAVSGGADSMALLLMLKEACDGLERRVDISDARRDVAIVALTFDHGLRQESLSEALQVSEWAKEIGVEHHILRPSSPIVDDDAIGGTAIQEKARRARYDAMIGYCLSHEIPQLYVAHHADDQLETFLIRLIGGSGLDGLCAMSKVSKRNGVSIVRPLLDITKRQLIEYLEDRGQSWIEDPSNYKDCYTRNRIRKIIPVLREEGLTAKRMSAVIGKLDNCRSALDKISDNWIEDCVRFEECRSEGNGNGDMVAVVYRAVMPQNMWKHNNDIPQEIKNRALYKILRKVNPLEKDNKKYPIRSEKLRRLLELLPSMDKSTTLAGCIIKAVNVGDDKFIHIEKENNV